MQKPLAETSMLVSLKLQACQNYYTELLSNYINADVSQTTKHARNCQEGRNVTENYLATY